MSRKERVSVHGIVKRAAFGFGRFVNFTPAAVIGPAFMSGREVLVVLTLADIADLLDNIDTDGVEFDRSLITRTRDALRQRDEHLRTEANGQARK